MGDDIKQLLFAVAQRHDLEIIQMETDKDHVHLLISYKPDISISSIVRCMKQESTFGLWKRHEFYLKQHYWKRKILWSEGYFACSIGQVSQTTIEAYIRNQG